MIDLNHDCTISPEDSCDCQNVDYLMQIVLNDHNSLFSANNRNPLADTITIEELI